MKTVAIMTGGHFPPCKGGGIATVFIV